MDSYENLYFDSPRESKFLYSLKFPWKKSVFMCVYVIVKTDKDTDQEGNVLSFYTVKNTYVSIFTWRIFYVCVTARRYYTCKTRCVSFMWDSCVLLSGSNFIGLGSLIMWPGKLESSAETEKRRWGWKKNHQMTFEQKHLLDYLFRSGRLYSILKKCRYPTS